MSGNGETIQTEAYIHAGDDMVEMENVVPAEHSCWSTKLKKRYINELFAGKLCFAERRLPSGKQENTEDEAE